MQKGSYDITIFLIVVTGIIVLLIAFIITMLLIYRKKQNDFHQILAQTILDHEKTILKTHLEIQEQTFQHISREIHDNITLSLTLSKLNLHTLDRNNPQNNGEKLDNAIELITRSIAELSDISKSLNADIIIQHGLLKAVEEEIQRIRHAGLFTIQYELTGDPVYMESRKELIIFRIIQEAFNNIIKHAGATEAGLILHYNTKTLHISVSDNGNGFDKELIMANTNGGQAGLKNMATRVAMLKGEMKTSSQPGKGTILSFSIPFE